MDFFVFGCSTGGIAGCVTHLCAQNIEKQATSLMLLAASKHKKLALVANSWYLFFSTRVRRNV